MKRLFLYLTNNLERSTHEAEWDIITLIGMTVMIAICEYHMLFITPDYGWAAGMMIWYLQAVDQIRHNRE